MKKKNRNRLLILLAILSIGLAPMSRTVYAASAQIFLDSQQSGDPRIGPYSGEPDGSSNSAKTPTQPHSASNLVPADGGRSSSGVPRAMWLSLAIRIWAAMHLGVGQ